jgi:uncharacterized SAM-binding protein YcdF (DUF218 family)
VTIVLEKTALGLISTSSLAWLLTIASLVALLRNDRRLAILTTIATAAILWVAGSSVIGSALAHRLEAQHIPSGELPHADAIVVLAGVTGKAYPPQPVSHLHSGADRLIYAAKLYKEKKAPLLILGGNSDESSEMAGVMTMMGIARTAMLLGNATLQNTYGDVRDLRPILLSHNVRTILLVTSAIRMPRALAVCRSLGIAAIPAPTDFTTRTMPAGLNVLQMVVPTGGSPQSEAVFHELIGLIGYRLVGWIHYSAKAD